MTTGRKPPRHETDPTQALLGFLDDSRATIERKLRGLSDAELRTSRLPSGWTPLQLLQHLVFMERRWLQWGFLAEPLEAPFGDCHDDDRNQPWHVASDTRVNDLLADLHRTGARTRAIAEAAPLATLSTVGGRFGPGNPPPTLLWILAYVLQEYARHTGHLDIARELADGATGV